MKKHLLKKAKVNRSHFGNAVVFILVALFGVFMALPFVYAVGNSLKPLNELWLFPPRLWPLKPTFENFKSIWGLVQNSSVPMSRYLFNTIFITVVGTTGQVFFCSLCAYALAKHPFPGNKLIFKVIFFSLMFNAAVTQIPTYLLMAKLHWIDTYYSLIVPAIGSSFGLYLIKQFIEQLNDSILEAARIDGAGEFRIYSRIVMPMIKPAWLTLIVFSVQALWNSGTTVYIFREELKTFSYAISQMVSGGIARAGAASAASVIMMIVPIVVYVITQSNIIDTMASSGVKE
ncbi:MAG: carbohydrate ABC transporter permease [Clostridia bacterium]|nr:carbohydrate ABC transporter permease [Clostridia bacterium]